MSEAAGSPATWPADIIHVNEDGWVLVNRGRAHGVLPGLRLLVVGSGIRELRQIFAPTPSTTPGEAAERPIALRTRRTYEQLEVVYSEDTCAVAIATRTPTERRPEFYRGPEGELLVWVPLPAGFTWPQPGADDDDVEADTPPADNAEQPTGAWDAEPDDGATSRGSGVDTPPERGEQDDERWEEALPLNGVSVGDYVVPALPASPSGLAPSATPLPTATPPGSPPAAPRANPFESGRAYDWMEPGR